MSDFYIDKQQTIKFYQDYNDICHCLYCENYYKYIEIEYPYLKEYLSKFNIDILKPIEVMEYPLNENKSQYEAFYAVCGNLSKEHKEKVKDLLIEFMDKEVLEHSITLPSGKPYYWTEVKNHLKKVTLLPCIPSITYTFKF